MDNLHHMEHFITALRCILLCICTALWRIENQLSASRDSVLASRRCGDTSATQAAAGFDQSIVPRAPRTVGSASRAFPMRRCKDLTLKHRK